MSCSSPLTSTEDLFSSSGLMLEVPTKSFELEDAGQRESSFTLFRSGIRARRFMIAFIMLERRSPGT